MADDMYDESEPTTAESDEMADSDNGPDKKDAKSDESEDQLALVPKSFFKNEMNPGDREKVEVVEAYEDEYSLKCIYDDDAEKDEGEESEEKTENEPTDAAYE